MKKAIWIVLAVITCAVTVRAESTVFYHEDSQYTILIPETIVADGTQYTFEAPVIDLCEGDCVEVSIGDIEMSGSVKLHTASGKEMIAEMYGAFGKLAPGQQIARFYNGMSQAGLVYALPFSTEGAGDYYGNVTFNINLVHEG